MGFVVADQHEAVWRASEPPFSAQTLAGLASILCMCSMDGYYRLAYEVATTSSATVKAGVWVYVYSPSPVGGSCTSLTVHGSMHVVMILPHAWWTS